MGLLHVVFEMNTWKVCWSWPTNQIWHQAWFLFFVDFTPTVKMVDQFGFYVTFIIITNKSEMVLKSVIW